MALIRDIKKWIFIFQSNTFPMNLMRFESFKTPKCLTKVSLEQGFGNFRNVIAKKF
jgi:hypothetical protein